MGSESNVMSRGNTAATSQKTLRLTHTNVFSRRSLNKLQAYVRHIFSHSEQPACRKRHVRSRKTRKSNQTRSEEQVLTKGSCPSSRASSTPAFQKALTVVRKGEYELRHRYETPETQGKDEVMIRNCCVGLNPIDWKSVAFNFCLPEFPWITGREMSGIVEKVGANVTHVRRGDRVWTSTYYRDVRAGCFQEYVVVPQHTVLQIPARLSFEEASCLGVAALTAGMAIWRWLNIPVPRINLNAKLLGSQSSNTDLIDSAYQSATSLSVSSSSSSLATIDTEAQNDWILIWGGSTITGQFATQLARLSGLKPITICSERTRSVSQGCGAEHVVVRDNREPSDILAEISSVTKGGITHAIDLVGEKTAGLCLEACSTPQQVQMLGGRQVIFAPLAMMSASQEVPETVKVETVEMKQFVLDASCRTYAIRLNELIEAGCLHLPELEILDGGLAAIQDGLELVRKGDRNGRKVIVRI